MGSTSARLLRAVHAARLQATKFPSRGYATDQPELQRNKNNTWLVISACLGIPAAYYLLMGNSSKPAKGSLAMPSNVEEAASPKSSSGQNTMSSNQEGLSNTDRAHPYVNSPSFNKKREGQTDSAKAK
ncbi:hypothetical protein P175DRAFT_0525715 [Aspergillus ochraceoroseus IBT 24754]|uniref:Uncharacterized protein n=1 Tax=Aspergillus ochraceoroseus IBT 24754 TaxID=1392256 RepID=A0A2T5LRS6_9EURO|nr:uncharacterized protein P175DRAFT_0525715 [Aspergillus ochraceoroseus IBT 24754]PTU18980.1 hypothetical protein P175DRAFT_0525715 [Aspergillus ochraceoroseus IBT 24754]